MGKAGEKEYDLEQRAKFYTLARALGSRRKAGRVLDIPQGTQKNWYKDDSDAELRVKCEKVADENAEKLIIEKWSAPAALFEEDNDDVTSSDIDRPHIVA